MSRPPVFDPRQVPVHGQDGHLPAVGRERLAATALRERFARPPPWQPEVMSERRWDERTPRHAAVLVPLVDRPEPTVLLTQRTEHLPTHAGQVAFPGGKVDDEDHDVRAAALRETHEEIGLDHHWVDIIGHLPEYTTGSAFIITPVVALVRPGFALRPNPGEVAAVFEVPLAFLMNPAHHRRHRLTVDGVTREWFSMPYTDAQAERFIWGATAGMLRNLYRMLSA